MDRRHKVELFEVIRPNLDERTQKSTVELGSLVRVGDYTAK